MPSLPSLAQTSRQQGRQTGLYDDGIPSLYDDGIPNSIACPNGNCRWTVGDDNLKTSPKSKRSER